jgi:hypothetical protein
MAGLLRTRRAETEQTLGSLKDRRQQVQQRYQQPAATQAQSGEDNGQKPSRQMRFQAEADASPDGDFAAAVGAAQEPTQEAAPKQGDNSQSQSERSNDEATSTSSRLRAAKQRTRQKLQRDDRET